MLTQQLTTVNSPITRPAMHQGARAAASLGFLRPLASPATHNGGVVIHSEKPSTTSSAAPRTTPRHAVTLRGVSLTMLQTLAIRALRMDDRLAMSLLRRLDFDFSTAAHDEALSQAVIARTLALDSLTASYVAAYPQGVVVNLAAGLDTRFHRLATAGVTWFNVDLPDVSAARARLLGRSKNLIDLAGDATRADWARHVRSTLAAMHNDGSVESPRIEAMHNTDLSNLDMNHTNANSANQSGSQATGFHTVGSELNATATPVLVLMEGLSMYLDDEHMRRILDVVASAFPNVMLVVEAITPRAVANAVMPSIAATGSAFTWGARHGSALHSLEPRLAWSADVPLENRDHYLAILTSTANPATGKVPVSPTPNPTNASTW